MTKFLPFVYDKQGFFTNQKCFIVTGEGLGYLTAFLNSSLFKLCFRDSFPELLGDTRELSKVYFEKIPIKKIDEESQDIFEQIVLDMQIKEDKTKLKRIDSLIFDVYELTKEERNYINSIDSVKDT